MANAALVKMSKSHICHDTNSRYYNRTKNFTPFDTLQACLDAGGRLPKGQSSLAPITTSKQAVGATYKRDYFGKGWADENHDCQNSRMEALISQSTGQNSETVQSNLWSLDLSVFRQDNHSSLKD